MMTYIIGIYYKNNGMLLHLRMETYVTFFIMLHIVITIYVMICVHNFDLICKKGPIL